MKSWWDVALTNGWLLAGCFGALVYLVVAGPGPIDPTNVGWIYEQVDIAGAYTGWTLFRDTPWATPIAANPAYGMDFSGSILFSDAIPLMAIPFKAISPLLPDDFQYFGLWTFTSFVLQGMFAWLLVSKVATDRLVRLLGAILISVTPIYIYRLVSCTHMSLTAHWLVLGALYMCLPPTARRHGFIWALLIAASAFVHAYLFCMVAALWLADLTRRAFLDTRRTLMEFAAVSASNAALVLSTGVWSGPAGEQQGGFGWFKMNVLSFLDPEPWLSDITEGRPAWSHVLPNIPNWGGDYEGFAYLGLGGLLLMAAAAWALWRQWPLIDWKIVRPYWPLATVVVGMTVFAISRNVTFGNVNFYIWWPGPLEHLGQLFRATGRFVWPLYYLAFAGAILLLARQLPAKPLLGLLGVLVLIQAVDLEPGWRRESSYLHVSGPGRPIAFDSPFWEQAAERYQAVRMAPYSNQGPRYLDIAAMARRHGLVTDASYLSRTRTSAEAASAARIEHGVATGEWPQDTMFVLVDPTLIERLQASNDPARNGLFRVDGVAVLTPDWAGCRDCGAEVLQ